MENLPFKILFLCTGNSARSIIAEYLLREIDPKRFATYSAGAKPTGKINPFVLKMLKEKFQIDASDARSKSWDEFKSFHFDFVITVCDNTKESCPIWRGQPIIAHWGFEDPASFMGTDEEKLKETFRVAMQIRRRLDLFCALPMDKMDRLRLENDVQEIGRFENIQ